MKRKDWQIENRVRGASRSITIKEVYVRIVVSSDSSRKEECGDTPPIWKEQFVMAFFDLFRKKETATELKQRALELEKCGRHTEAADCNRKLAEMGDAGGMLMYAMYLADCNKYTEAANWARRLAEMGEPRGMFLYATYLRDGKGVQRDMQQSMVWLQKSADSGCAPAQKALAICKKQKASMNREGW